MLKTSVTIWDRLGIGLSAVCLIHCLALPVVVSLLPMVPVPEFIHDWSHPVLAVVILPTIVQAIRRSAHDRRIHAYLIGGFVVILTGWAVGHSVFGALAETLFTVAGSVLLIIGHVLNYRHHRVCKNTQHHHHPELEQGRAEGHLHEHSHGHEQNHEHVHSHDHGHAHHHPH